MTAPILPNNPSLATFGGPYKNADAVINPETDLDADKLNLLIAHAVAASFPAVRAWAQVAVVSGVATLQTHGAVWGDGAAVAPTVTRSSAGNYIVAWSSAPADLQAVPETHSFSARACGATLNRSQPGSAGNVMGISAYVLGAAAFVSTYLVSTGAASDASFTVWVW